MTNVVQIINIFSYFIQIMSQKMNQKLLFENVNKNKVINYLKKNLKNLSNR